MNMHEKKKTDIRMDISAKIRTRITRIRNIAVFRTIQVRLEAYQNQLSQLAYLSLKPQFL